MVIYRYFPDGQGKRTQQRTNHAAFKINGSTRGELVRFGMSQISKGIPSKMGTCDIDSDVCTYKLFRKTILMLELMQLMLYILRYICELPKHGKIE